MNWIAEGLVGRRAQFSTVILYHTDDPKRFKQFVNFFVCAELKKGESKIVRKAFVYFVWRGLFRIKPVTEEGELKAVFEPVAQSIATNVPLPASMGAGSTIRSLEMALDYMDHLFRTEEKIIFVIYGVFQRNDTLTSALRCWTFDSEIYDKGHTIVVFTGNPHVLFDEDTLKHFNYVKVPASTEEERREILTKFALRINNLTEEDLKKLLNGIGQPYRKVRIKVRSELIKATAGLNLHEVESVALMSFYRYADLKPEVLAQYKNDIIRKSGILDIEEPEHGFEAVGGYDVLKQFIKDNFIKILQNPAKAEKLGLRPPRGLLLFGMGGTGKTWFAKALAKELKLPFLRLRTENIVSKYYGETERSMARALELAEEIAPCILFIDECLPENTVILTPLGYKKIKEIKKGDKVYGFDGEKIVVCGVEEAKCTGIKQTIIAEIENGDCIEATPNHPVLTRDGFKPICMAEEIAIPLVKPYNMSRDAIIGRLLGYVFGDGYLAVTKSKEGYEVYVVGFSGKREDLERIAEDIRFLLSDMYSCKIYSRATKSEKWGIEGTTNELKVGKRLFEILKEYGAPVGVKKIQDYRLPKQLFNNKEMAREFLGALFGADGSIPHIMEGKRPHDIVLVFHKDKNLKESGMMLAQDIVNLLNKFGVNANIKIKETVKAFKFEIHITNSEDNIIKFLREIGYRYCKRKEIQSTLVLNYLLMKQRVRKNREKLCALARRDIIVETIPRTTYLRWSNRENERVWATNVESFEEFKAKRVVGDLLFLKIINKEKSKTRKVYNLKTSCGNYIAKNYIVHNCDRFGQRGQLGEHEATRRTFSILLEWLGDARRKTIVIGTTNRPEDLDEAFIRVGRFDYIIPMLLPDLKARRQILEVHTKIIRKVPLAKNVNLDEIARKTEWFTGAEIEELVLRSARNALKNDRDKVTAEDFETALNTFRINYDARREQMTRYLQLAEQFCNDEEFLGNLKRSYGVTMDRTEILLKKQLGL